MKTYYKVVTPTLRSAMTSMWSSKEELIIEYKVGEWVYPKVLGTYLFVFKTLQNAKDFIHECGISSYYIYKCLGVNEHKILGMCPGIYGDRILQAAKLKRQKKKYLHLFDKEVIPNGTVGVEALKLIKEINLF